MPQPIWLSRPLVDHMHVELVREHGGEYGIRDENLLRYPTLTLEKIHATITYLLSGENR